MEPGRNQGGENQYFHCSDCDLTVHRNDRDNHINGARHKYRIRKNDQQTKNEDRKLCCRVCNTEFTDMEFYTVHLGSKTHKRNVRRAQKSGPNKIDIQDAANKASLDGKFAGIRPVPRRVPLHGIDAHLPINDYTDVSDYKSIREVLVAATSNGWILNMSPCFYGKTKYRLRNTKNPEGNNKTYICSVTAYWAVSLALEPTVKDFSISVNDKEWGDFGDVVVQIEYKETKEKLGFTTSFAVQFKEISNNAKTLGSFSEGKFGFAKYITQINAIKLRKDVDNKKFVVFTTAMVERNTENQFKLKSDIVHSFKQDCKCEGEGTEISVVTKTLSNRRRFLINTSDDNDNIYFFFCTDKTHVLPKIYLYTHQQKQKYFGSWIDDTINGSLYGDRKRSIHRDLIKYIEYWGDGYLGGTYKLKKEDVLVKLGHLLLYIFKIPPVAKATDRKDFRIWQKAVHTVDMVVLRNHPVVRSRICEPLNLKIETELDLKIDTTTSSIDLDQNIVQKIKNPVLKMYLFEETLGEIQDNIPLEIVYDFFWKAGLIPLMLHVKDSKEQDHILDVVNLLKTLGLTRRYFLISSVENVRNTLRYYKTLSFFMTVDDIASKIHALMDTIKITVSEKFALSLRDIQDSDMFFQKTVSAYEFFDMSLGEYSFKPFSYNLARKYGQDTKLVLNDDTLRKMKEEIDSKDEIKMAISKYDLHGNKQFLRGVKPNLFS